LVLYLYGAAGLAEWRVCANKKMHPLKCMYNAGLEEKRMSQVNVFGTKHIHTGLLRAPQAAMIREALFDL